MRRETDMEHDEAADHKEQINAGSTCHYQPILRRQQKAMVNNDEDGSNAS